MAEHELGGVSGQETPSRSGGRPEYKPTDDQRAAVRSMKADGKSNAAIAAAVGISPNTLRKHFAAELKAAPAPAVEQQLALGGVHHAVSATVDVRPPGRPEFEPTQRQREDVRLWAADDWSEERMAQQLGIARETLRKHFADEIQYGADRIRTQVLRDLERSSRAGRVGASAKLLEITSMVAPPSAPKAERPEAPPEPLGKKAQAIVDAKSADVGSDWADLVH